MHLLALIMNVIRTSLGSAHFEYILKLFPVVSIFHKIILEVHLVSHSFVEVSMCFFSLLNPFNFAVNLCNSTVLALLALVQKLIMLKGVNITVFIMGEKYVCIRLEIGRNYRNLKNDFPSIFCIAWFFNELFPFLILKSFFYVISHLRRWLLTAWWKILQNDPLQVICLSIPSLSKLAQVIIFRESFWRGCLI